MKLQKNILTKSRISYLLALIPIFILSFYLYKNVVNTPFWDQWEIVPIIQNIKAGNFYFNDFWQQHNEHRLLFPRILMITSAIITSWNLRAEVFISLVLAVASFVVLLKVVNGLEEEKHFTVPFLLPLILSGLWFSLLQYENWTWGWQIQWYLNVLAIVTVIYALAKINTKPTYGYLALAATGAFVAQYSLGNGVLIWPLLITALLYLRLEMRKIGFVAVSAVLSTALYYLNYSDPKGDPSKALFLEQPIAYIKYVSAYLGRPLAYDARIAAISGVGLALLFLAFSFYLYIKKPERFKKALPFIVLGLYAIASAVITGLSRLGLGLGQSLSSRYTTISTLLLVSTVIVIAFNRDIIADILKKAYKPLWYMSTIILIVAIVLNMNWGRQNSDIRMQYIKDIKGCTSETYPYEICLLSTYPNKEKVTPLLNYLKSIGWGGYN